MSIHITTTVQNTENTTFDCYQLNILHGVLDPKQSFLQRVPYLKTPCVFGEVFLPMHKQNKQGVPSKSWAVKALGAGM